MLHGGGITDDEFLDAVLSCMRGLMLQDGNEIVFRRFVAPASREVRFSKPLSRSITGSMNDLVRCGTFWLADRDLSPFATSSKLNEMPMSGIGYKHPREAFKGLNVERFERRAGGRSFT